MSSRGPASIEPPGAPSPFENATDTRSNGAASVAAGTPLATSAFHSRAPSRYEAMPCSRAAAHTRDGLVVRKHDAAGAVVGVLDLDERGRPA